jgi:glucose uptake protein GlcU
MFVFGWPEVIPDYSDRFTSIFLNVFWVALAIELIIGLTEHKTKVHKDERDEKIEAYGHKYAYSFLTVSIVAILFQMLLSNFFGVEGSQYLLLGSTSMIFHVLFIVLFSSSMIKRITMIYHYRKE